MGPSILSSGLPTVSAKAGKPSGRLGIFPMTAIDFVRILGRMRKLRVAVDIGGTFTDLVAYDENTRQLITVKTPSTPPEFIQGVMDALQKAQVSPEEIIGFKHGSTIATNAIIERKGARTGLLTTMGMRDVLGA